jgi:hypothetical protein
VIFITMIICVFSIIAICASEFILSSSTLQNPSLQFIGHALTIFNILSTA